MITKEQLSQLNGNLKRVFALPITRLTLREIQNVITNVLPDKLETGNALYTSLLTGEIDTKLKKDDGVESLVDTYSQHVRFAREIAEAGEYMNIFSCDFMQQGNRVFFVNRMRRIDGQEFYFFSAPDINVRLAHMFINRLRDLKKQAGKNIQFDPKIIQELENLKNDTEDLLST